MTDISGYEGLYAVTKEGKVWSFSKRSGSVVRKGLWLKPRLKKLGYLTVCLYKNDKGKTVNIHRLVGLTFISNPKKYKYLNHKNGIKTDNRVENLE